jgi:hypothetical protein
MTIASSTGPAPKGSTGEPVKPEQDGWVNDLVKSTHWLSPISTWRGVDEPMPDRTDEELWEAYWRGYPEQRP